MRDFFRGSRRKVGCGALVCSLVLMAAWIKSELACDRVWLQAWSCQYCIDSSRGLLLWTIESLDDDSQFEPLTRNWETIEVEDTPPPGIGDSLLKSLGFEYGLNRYDAYSIRFLSFPYWSVVVPLTAVSAWLLLGKSRPEKPPERPG